jgi:hypothetical protein
MVHGSAPEVDHLYAALQQLFCFVRQNARARDLRPKRVSDLHGPASRADAVLDRAHQPRLDPLTNRMIED